jgi:glycerol kinase
MLMNLETLDWEEDLLKEFGVPRSNLPKIMSSTDNFGVVKEGIMKNVPIMGVIGDQQSACIGHSLKIGEVKNTYGTGCFMLMNTGEDIVHSNYGLLTTLLYKYKDDKALYALEGAVEVAGSAIVWLKNNMRLFNDFNEMKTKFYEVKDNGGVVFVPAFCGLYTPHWDLSARGLIIGLTNSTEQGHIIRATLEAISLRSLEVLKSFESDSKSEVVRLRVDGGLTASEEFLQTQSNVAGIEVVKQKEKEITVIGCAITAGLGVNFWNKEELDKLINIEKCYNPQWSDESRTNLISKWSKAINKAKNWLD